MAEERYRLLDRVADAAECGCAACLCVFTCRNWEPNQGRLERRTVKTISVLYLLLYTVVSVCMLSALLLSGNVRTREHEDSGKDDMQRKWNIAIGVWIISSLLVAGAYVVFMSVGHIPPEHYAAILTRARPTNGALSWGILLFGLGTVSLSVFSMTEYMVCPRNDTVRERIEVENHLGEDTTDDGPLVGFIAPLMSTIFVFLEMSCLRRFQTAPFAGRLRHYVLLFHLVGVHLLLWVNAFIVEIVEGTEQVRSKGISLAEGERGMNKSNWTSSTLANCADVKDVLKTVRPILYPCTMEFSLLMAGVFSGLWQKTLAITHDPNDLHQREQGNQPQGDRAEAHQHSRPAGSPQRNTDNRQNHENPDDRENPVNRENPDNQENGENPDNQGNENNPNNEENELQDGGMPAAQVDHDNHHHAVNDPRNTDEGRVAFLRRLQVHNGLTLVLAAAVIVFIIVLLKLGDTKDTGSPRSRQVHNYLKAFLGFRVGLLVAMVWCCVAGLGRVRRLPTRPVVQDFSFKVLLIVSATGLTLNCVLSSIATISCIGTKEYCDGSDGTEVNLITADIVMHLVQTFTQITFLLEASKRDLGVREAISNRFLRGLLYFLSATNFLLWTCDTFYDIHTQENVSLQTIGGLFYGQSVWLILTRLTFPLTIFFHFHSFLYFHNFITPEQDVLR